MPEILTNEYGRIVTVDGQPKPHITDVLADLGLSKNFDGVDPYYASRGSAVHLACKFINGGVLDEATVSEDCSGFVKAYRLFLSETGFSVEFSEIPLYSQLHDYCGTLDIVGFLPEIGRVVIDLKTSSSIDPAVELQVGAQAILWEENYKDKPIEKRMVLQLKSDGTFVPPKDLTHIQAYLFLDVLKVWRWKMSHKRKGKIYGV